MGVSVSVLVVEDDPDLRCLHRLWLAEDYDVTAVADGESALAEIDETVDVVLLDRDLPGIDGDAVARKLDDDGYQGLIAMVTGREPDRSIARLPIDDYVTKPVDAAEVGSIVSRLSARRQAPPAVRTLFGLLTRRARLESSLDETRLADSDPFDELARKIDDQRATVKQEAPTRQVPSLAEDCLPTVVDCDRALGSGTRIEQ